MSNAFSVVKSKGFCYIFYDEVDATSSLLKKVIMIAYFNKNFVTQERLVLNCDNEMQSIFTKEDEFTQFDKGIT